MNELNIERLRKTVENIHSLPTIPETVKRISGIIENPNMSLNDIGKFIANDPALTTKILKMVNSAVYGFPGRISLVSHATVLLGLNVIKGLLIGVSVAEYMETAMTGLWSHSLACAFMARILAQKKKIEEPEEVYAAGLLHDIGKVILIQSYRSEYEAVMSRAKEKGGTVHEEEKHCFPVHHGAVGGWLAEQWHFPMKLVEIIRNHHEPLRSRIAPTETALVHLSDILVRARGIGFPGDDSVPVINPQAYELLDIAESDIREALQEMEAVMERTEDKLSP